MLKRYFWKKLEQKIARGVIVIDKESGVTSHDEVDRLRKIFNTRKVGHSGTLDPKVTGVLVCGLGQGTKVLEYVLLSQKIYDCEIVFHKTVDQADFETVIKKFTGTITQLPPVKSSVKRVERQREVYDLTLLDFAADGRTAHLRCAVERGTYIRKLCHDMGQMLGAGAHMGDLRRIQAGPYRLDNSHMVTTEKLQNISNNISGLAGWWYVRQLIKYIEPIESVLQGIASLTVDSRLAGPIASGADLFVPGVIKSGHFLEGDMVQIVDTAGMILAVGYAAMDSEKVATSTSGVAVRISKRIVPPKV